MNGGLWCKTQTKDEGTKHEKNRSEKKLNLFDNPARSKQDFREGVLEKKKIARRSPEMIEAFLSGITFLIEGSSEYRASLQLNNRKTS